MAGSLDDIEYELLICAVKQRYGYDFSQYAPASFRRRVSGFVISHNLKTITQLTDRLLHYPEFFEQFIRHVSVTVTEMFRDPGVFNYFRSSVLPELATFPHINIWVAGCATGEEPYSLAIVLHELGLLEKSEIFATDINRASILKAEQGMFSSEQIQVATKNYIDAGGVNSFNSYYSSFRFRIEFK